MITKIKHFFILLIMGSGVMMLQACKKDSVIESKPEVSIIESKPEVSIIEQAKTYFETQVLTGKAKEQLPTVSKFNTGVRQSLFKNALWEKAHSRKTSIGEAVIVPLRYNKSLYTKIGKNKESVSVDYLSYLMIYKTPKGSMTAELVTWIPDDTYWDNRRIKNTSFSGKVIVETWQGKFIKGYSYDGKGQVRAIEIKEASNKENQTSSAPIIECQITDWYSCVSVDGRQTWYCKYDYTETTCYVISSSTSGGASGGGAPIAGISFGSGGGPAPGDYPPSNLSPCESPVIYSTKGNSVSVVSPCIVVEPTQDLDYYYSGENMDDSDDNTETLGPKAHFPSSITLNNGTIIKVIFGSTTDGTANQEISTKLIEAVIGALNIASQTVSITSIYIKATTNGSHHPLSNHYRGLAVDISRINGQYIVNMGANNMINALQSAFESIPNRRENFGPAMKTKLGQPWTVPGHNDHLHFSVNGD